MYNHFYKAKINSKTNRPLSKMVAGKRYYVLDGIDFNGVVYVVTRELREAISMGIIQNLCVNNGKICVC